MRTGKIILATLLVLTVNTFPAFSLIRIDDESVDLAIKYGIKSKGMITRDILGPNWKNDGTGRVLTIYSPFIQIALKATNSNTTDNIENDIKKIKLHLTPKIDNIKKKNEIRFFVDIYGDKEDFAQNYKAYIVNNKKTDNPKIIKPKKTSVQKIADKDGYNPEHPYSAINCYIFKFDDLFKLEEYSFILTNENGEQIKYKINKQDIF